MATKLIAPRLGEGVEELTLMRWLKKVGEKVEENESIVEVETDKVVTEIPSPVTGTLLVINVPEGETVKVGDTMGLIGESGESSNINNVSVSEPVAKSKVETKESESEPARIEKVGTEDVTTFTSPVVRKLAEEHDIDLSQITGSGKGGRITREDLNSHLTDLPQAQNVVEASIPEPEKTEKLQPASKLIQPSGEGNLLPLTSARKQIAERMVLSMATSPHVLSVMEADLSKVLAHREIHKPLLEKEGVNLTLTAYFIKAIAKGLRNHPLLNASWTEEGILTHNDVNIGFAVALGDAGLIVPVILGAQNLSLQGIAKAVNDLGNRAHSKQLKPEEVRNATFTLTNHGTGGSLFASPIINQPQLAILGTGLMQKRPIVITDAFGNDSLGIRPMIYLSLVFDHRAIDGESGDAFLSELKNILENWSE